MGEPKPLASLSSSLLARKGQARPAMRPQGFAGFSNPMGNGHDDLGWNDMGHDAPRPVAIIGEDHNGYDHDAPVPDVVRQRAELAEEFSSASEDVALPIIVSQDMELPHPVTEIAAIESLDHDPVPEAETIHVPAPPPIAPRSIPSVAVARAKKAARGRKTKAAFTLRLDPDRHLKLRLACAISRDSAQAIVTEALDRYLGGMPEIDELVRKVPTSA